MKKTKTEFFDKLEELVETGQTEQLDALQEEYFEYCQESTIPFENPTNPYCRTGFNNIEKNFLESLQFLPTLSPEALKTYAEFYRSTDNRGMMQALQKYGTENGYQVEGLLEDPEEMLTTFDGVLAKATEVMEMDKTTEEYITAKEQLQSMIDQALRPEEIVITSQN